MRSHRLKRRLFLFNCCICLLAVYFYRRHNKYCEAGSECNISTVLSFTPPMFLSAIVPFWVVHMLNISSQILSNISILLFD